VYRLYAADLFQFLERGFAVHSRSGMAIFPGYRQAAELEDAASEVFLRAFAEAARHAFDGLRPYRNYLFAIARHWVIDDLRRRGRQPSADQIEDTSDASNLEDTSPCADPAAAHADAQLDAYVQAFLRDLSEDEQKVYRARFEQGLSIERAARDLDVSEHRIKRTERRLRKRFFVVMRRHGYFEGYRSAESMLGRIVSSTGRLRGLL
jgi:RNA polymerase sigma factor (sigma-70 family)